MKTRTSYLLWVIFIILALICFAIVFPKYGLIAKRMDNRVSTTLTTKFTILAAANYTLRTTNHALGMPLTDCSQVKTLEVNAKLPQGYEVASKPLAKDQLNTCTLVSPNGRSSEFTVIGIS